MRRSGAEPRQSRWAWAVPLVALALAVAATLADPTVLRLLRNATFDQFQRWQPRAYLAPRVRVVDIDEESLRRLGQWPWRRDRVAALVTRIQQLGAASIALDIMFAEPDRTSPAALLQDAALPASVTRALYDLPDHDEQLAHALSRSNTAVGFALLADSRRSATDADPEAALHLRAGYLAQGGDPLRVVPAFASSVASLERLQNAAPGQGAMTFVPGPDGIVRQVPLLMNLAGQLVPSLVAEALRLAAHADHYTVRSDAGGAGVIDVQIGQRRIDTDAAGSVWVHYTAPRPERYVPAWKVLDEREPVAGIEHCIVLVGTSAQGLMDLRFSPRGGVIPGVEVHAQALEQVLSGQHLSRPGWAPAAELVAAVVGGLAVGTIAMVCGAALSTFGFVAIATLLCAGAWAAFVQAELLLDPATPSLALALVFMPTTVMRHLSSERRQRWVKQAFARYVSPNLVDYLVANPEALELGGKRQRCSFVFADLAGFTGLMETLDPTVAVGLLNAYLDRMIAIAFEHEGTLDRIVGDAIAIVFSAPIEQVDHERRALRCALQMHSFAREYVDDLARQGLTFCETRLGVHTGEVTVGNFGGTTIFDYRALGDPVNTASRLEGANRYLGTLVCVSEATLAGCPGAPARPVGLLTLSGRVEPVMAFEPVTGGAEGDPPDTPYLHAFELMRSGRPEALQAFETLARERPDDPLATLHATRLRTGETGIGIELRRK